jgi:RNA polymerase sigma-70 factor (ECF subfamily)
MCAASLPDTERDFVQRLKANDPAAYEELIETYAEMVFRVAYRILKDEQDAEDAMQETFLSIHRRIQSFRGESKFSSWLYRVATNVALDALRARKRYRGHFTELSDDQDDEMEAQLTDALQPLPEEQLTRQETQERIYAILSVMSPKLSEAFVLYEIEGLSMQETADALGISLSTAKVRVHRARLQLQAELSRCLSEVQA